VLSGYRGSVKSKKYIKTWKQELRASPELFSTKIISRHSSRKEALLKEKLLHEKLNVVNNELYINESIAGGSFGFSRKGNPGKRSEETKRKISEGRKGKGTGKRPEHIGKRISEALQNHNVSEDTKKKISRSLSGRKITDEHKNAISLYQKGRKKSPDVHKKMWETRKSRSTQKNEITDRVN
jgi:hypothetical protein